MRVRAEFPLENDVDQLDMARVIAIMIQKADPELIIFGSYWKTTRTDYMEFKQRCYRDHLESSRLVNIRVEMNDTVGHCSLSINGIVVCNVSHAGYQMVKEAFNNAYNAAREVSTVEFQTIVREELGEERGRLVTMLRIHGETE